MCNIKRFIFVKSLYCLYVTSEIERQREIAFAVFPLVYTYYSSDLPHPPANINPGLNPGSDAKEDVCSRELVWLM